MHLTLNQPGQTPGLLAALEKPCGPRPTARGVRLSSLSQSAPLCFTRVCGCSDEALSCTEVCRGSTTPWILTE